jgi:hypothetical protein
VTVYVYKLKGQFWTQAYDFPWYGLTADREEELHAFAESLGQYRFMYRKYKSGDGELPVVGHYDLDQGERDWAVKRGAKVITTRECRKMLRPRPAELGMNRRGVSGSSDVPRLRRAGLMDRGLMLRVRSCCDRVHIRPG